MKNNNNLKYKKIKLTISSVDKDDINIDHLEPLTNTPFTKPTKHEDRASESRLFTETDKGAYNNLMSQKNKKEKQKRSNFALEHKLEDGVCESKVLTESDKEANDKMSQKNKKTKKKRLNCELELQAEDESSELGVLESCNMSVKKIKQKIEKPGDLYDSAVDRICEKSSDCFDNNDSAYVKKSLKEKQEQRISKLDTNNDVPLLKLTAHSESKANITIQLNLTFDLSCAKISKTKHPEPEIDKIRSINLRYVQKKKFMEADAVFTRVELQRQKNCTEEEPIVVQEKPSQMYTTSDVSGNDYLNSLSIDVCMPYVLNLFDTINHKYLSIRSVSTA